MTKQASVEREEQAVRAGRGGSGAWGVRAGRGGSGARGILPSLPF